jgi:hypothetical protein
MSGRTGKPHSFWENPENAVVFFTPIEGTDCSVMYQKLKKGKLSR